MYPKVTLGLLSITSKNLFNLFVKDLLLKRMHK